jgi:hypothetical protein
MKICLRFFVFAAVAMFVVGCAWYKGPPLQPNANATLDGSALDESSGPGFIKTLKSADNYGSGFDGYADDGGNYEVTNFDNVA